MTEKQKKSISKNIANGFRISEFNIPYYFFLLVIIISTIVSKGLFITPANLLELLNRASILGMIALGAGLVILTGGIDLSVGAILGLSVGTMTALLRLHISPGLVVIITLVITTLCGLFNGLVVANTKAPPFVITLGSSIALQSLGLLVVGARAEDLPQIVQLVRGSPIFGPIARFFPALMLFLAFLVIGILFYFTGFGVKILAIGGNEKAGKFAGINIRLIKTAVYTISGFFAGLGGFLLMFKVGGGNPTVGTPYLLESIMAVVIGGFSLYGGVGNIFNSFIGAFTMVTLANLLTILRVDIYLQDVFKGMLLLIFIFIMNSAIDYSRRMSQRIKIG
jgi:ribose transport system permease protein